MSKSKLPIKTIILSATALAVVIIVALLNPFSSSNKTERRVIQSEEDRKAQQEAQRIAQLEAQQKADEEKAAKQAQIDSAVFISERELALIVKDPDAHKGEIFKLWGEIAQFDSATGVDAFRAYVSHTRQKYWATYGEHVKLKGEKAMLADFIKDDIFTATVEVSSTNTYDNVMGGGNTVPLFIIHKIDRK